MHLYLLKRMDGPQAPIYDCMDGFIIRAGTEVEARLIAADACGDEGGEPWLSDERSTCEVVTTDGPACVLLCDFNAG